MVTGNFYMSDMTCKGGTIDTEGGRRETKERWIGEEKPGARQLFVHRTGPLTSTISKQSDSAAAQISSGLLRGLLRNDTESLGHILC
jgi:hypothetical protein